MRLRAVRRRKDHIMDLRFTRAVYIGVWDSGFVRAGTAVFPRESHISARMDICSEQSAAS